MVSAIQKNECAMQGGEARLQPQTIPDPGRVKTTPDECNLNATQLSPRVRRGAVWIRCTQSAHRRISLHVGRPRPEPHYQR